MSNDKIRKGVLVKPVVFFSEWLGIVLTNPEQYEPSENDEEIAAITAPVSYTHLTLPTNREV